jgi:hypothetical protein
LRPGDLVPDDVLDQTVVGVNLVPGTLRNQLGAGPTLLVFLRQLGCIFCREMVTRLREASAPGRGGSSRANGSAMPS